MYYLPKSVRAVFYIGLIPSNISEHINHHTSTAVSLYKSSDSNSFPCHVHFLWNHIFVDTPLTLVFTSRKLGASLNVCVLPKKMQQTHHLVLISLPFVRVFLFWITILNDCHEILLEPGWSAVHRPCHSVKWLYYLRMDPSLFNLLWRSLTVVFRRFLSASHVSIFYQLSPLILIYCW